eukprot:Platyproteum_vivax@DN1560_c0_g1_i1.p1
MATLTNRPTEIIFDGRKSVHCLILDSPDDYRMPTYIKVMKEFGVENLVRTCQKTYDEMPLECSGIKAHDLNFPDGGAPPVEVVNRWMALIERATGTVAVHCVAGLGRAPLLVAVALIEAGMDSDDAIAFIRKRRKGAINPTQLKYLENYKRRSCRKQHCIVM